LEKRADRFYLEARRVGGDRRGRGSGEKWPKQYIHIRINE
jgi:hypothetical protein